MEMARKIEATPAAPPVPAAASTPVVHGFVAAPAGALQNHFPTPWDQRCGEKLLDAVRKLFPKVYGEIAQELARSDRHATPYTVLQHLTSAGAQLLRENDHRHAHLKLSRAAEKGEVPTAPSLTPMLDACRRSQSTVWDPSKLAEYALTAVDYALMLGTLVNPALVVPSLVMLRHSLAVANGEHPSDWPHMVRFLDTEMKNVADPSSWPELLETLGPTVRRAGMDSMKNPKVSAPSSAPEVLPMHVPRLPQRAPQEYEQPQLANSPRDCSSSRCQNWNRGVKCAADDCLFTHLCMICGKEHPASRCTRRRDDQGDRDRRDDGRNDRRDDPKRGRR